MSPVYDLKCNKCELQVEVNIPYDDMKKATCLNCGSNMEQVYTKSQFILKGPCWAKNNYGNVTKIKAGESSKR